MAVYSVRDLWVYLKSVVYQIRPQDIDTLKANICSAINNVPEDMLRRSMHNVRTSVEMRRMSAYEWRSFERRHLHNINGRLCS